MPSDTNHSNITCRGKLSISAKFCALVIRTYKRSDIRGLARNVVVNHVIHDLSTSESVEPVP